MALASTGISALDLTVAFLQPFDRHWKLTYTLRAPERDVDEDLGRALPGSTSSASCGPKPDLKDMAADFAPSDELSRALLSKLDGNSSELRGGFRESLSPIVSLRANAVQQLPQIY